MSDRPAQQSPFAPAEAPGAGIRERLHEIIFGAETPLGKAFDVALLWAIVISVVAVLLESVPEIRGRYGTELKYIEWAFTIVFTIEYFARLCAVRRPLRYARSFFGIVDLLAVVPTYLSIVFIGTHYFLVVRILRLLRIFRVFKLVRYTGEADLILRALMLSRAKITVFLGGVLTLVVIIGSLMYVIEGEANGFTSIPKSIYWAIVTLTTVGYGDVTPQTPLGQMLSALVMLIGYGIIAVPTGIVTAEITSEVQRRAKLDHRTCAHCGAEGHERDAEFCKFCGGEL